MKAEDKFSIMKAWEALTAVAASSGKKIMHRADKDAKAIAGMKIKGSTDDELLFAKYDPLLVSSLVSFMEEEFLFRAYDLLFVSFTFGSVLSRR
jgi:hypothetical protein